MAGFKKVAFFLPVECVCFLITVTDADFAMVLLYLVSSSCIVFKGIVPVWNVDLGGWDVCPDLGGFWLDDFLYVVVLLQLQN